VLSRGWRCPDPVGLRDPASLPREMMLVPTGDAAVAAAAAAVETGPYSGAVEVSTRGVAAAEGDSSLLVGTTSSRRQAQSKELGRGPSGIVSTF
jgi:hypothetical protein